MNLRQIEVFRAVMATGSVTAAARQLHVSQPGISRMLAHIQITTGLRLFERHKARLVPTPEARALHDTVEQVYRGVGGIGQRIAQIREGSGLGLRVLASPSTGIDLVPAALAALARAHPQARLSLEVVPAREMVSRLENHEADLAISTLPIRHAVLRSRVLGRWSLMAVLPRDHALARRRSVAPRELLREPLIAFAGDTPQGQALAQWARALGQTPRTQIEVRSGQVACALAARGVGLAVVDDLTARSSLDDTLLARPISGSPGFAIEAVTHEASAPSVLSRGFLALATRALRDLRAA